MGCSSMEQLPKLPVRPKVLVYKKIINEQPDNLDKGLALGNQ